MSQQESYDIFGFSLPEPPELNHHSIPTTGTKTPQVELGSTATKPPFAQQHLQFGWAPSVAPTANMALIDSAGFQVEGQSWRAGGSGTMVIQVTVPFATSATFSFVWCADRPEDNKSHTSCAIQVNDEAPWAFPIVSSSFGNWESTTTPSFQLEEGINTLKFTYFIASGNQLQIQSFSMIPPKIIETEIQAWGYWEVVGSFAASPESPSEYQLSLHTGKTNGSSSTSSWATTLGFSASAGIGAFSASLSVEFERTTSTTNSIELTETQTVTITESCSVPAGAKEAHYVWWAPRVEFTCNGLKWTQRLDSTIVSRALVEQ